MGLLPEQRVGADSDYFADFAVAKGGVILERETGIEPATNGLGSRYSTIELLPLDNCVSHF